ncbi:MAG TPA: protein disulfide oxidoreductase [Enterobacter asburiae]|uniref:protein disulfide oxidoreductase n=1 Tax=Enterobacter asburiae TaxID=61645 RepID=UPI000E9ABEF1|nr:protein disulfide oxidoreductase [Enterobacter asburiae]MBG0651933.1 protein disulfide oxidoreductase [Enterobacter asburiae]WJW89068.1 protein disulfide oxidoreductase [Enterobacter asburiae]HBW93298.1 protein disulfide oxidoreductase [Enterobacter asburiae]HCF67294.1 protein disulfide oxidoreductase [Enterobacter asburiae]HDW0118440.1 protein disulfide oxidoreductase [Enterobacter asburiae]
MDNRKNSRLRRWVREGIIFVLLTLAVVWGVDRYRKPTLPASFSATPMQSIDGNIHDIAALGQERPLLIYVWATWCSICRYTTPSVNKLAKEGGNVVSIAMRSGDNAKLARWVEKKQLKMPVINDENGALSQQWQVSVTPTLVIVAKGNVVSTTTGWTSYWGLKLRMWWAGV